MSSEFFNPHQEWQEWHPPAKDAAGHESGSEVDRYLAQTPKEFDLSTRESSGESSLTGSKNLVKFYTLKDDGSAIFKPASGEHEGLRHSVEAGTYYQHERAAYLVSKIFGLELVPSTVIRDMDGEIGSMQEFIPDADIATHFGIDKDDEQLKESLIKLWLFDYIIWNSDRHGGNLLIKDSSVLAIDNGLSFGADMLRTFKGFYGLEVPDHIKQLFVESAQNEQLLEILQEMLIELIPKLEVEACISRIRYLAETLQSQGLINNEYELPYDPNDDHSWLVADEHPVHDALWYKRTKERNESSEPDTAALLAMEQELGLDKMRWTEEEDQ